MRHCHHHHKRNQLCCALLIDHPQNRSYPSESQKDSQSFLELKVNKTNNYQRLLQIKVNYPHSNPVQVWEIRKCVRRYFWKKEYNIQTQNQMFSATSP